MFDQACESSRSSAAHGSANSTVTEQAYMPDDVHADRKMSVSHVTLMIRVP